MELEQRLGLYQVFLKLYEHHRTLLDEILQLEKTDNKAFSRMTTRCVTGVIQQQQVYLVTNLVDGKTQTLFQAQGIWTVGRDRQLSIPVPDKRLSRRHAAIQYIKHQGFYLIDLNSTNGSFINGEPIHGRMLLRDGDCVRLGSLTFSFFLCKNNQTLGSTPPDILAQLEALTVTPNLTTIQQATAPASVDKGKIPTTEPKKEVSHLLHKRTEHDDPTAEAAFPKLSVAQQAAILDRFFRRQIQKVSEHN